MFGNETNNVAEFSKQTPFLSRFPPDLDHPALVRMNSSLLFKLDKNPEQYKDLLKKKDWEFTSPIVNYFTRNSDDMIFLGGDCVNNSFLNRRRKYKVLNILAVSNYDDIEEYCCIMNNIISSNDGAFSMKVRYSVKKNRCPGCFSELALARYIVEPRLVGPEKLLYPFRSSSIELDLTTRKKFSDSLSEHPKAADQPAPTPCE